MIGHSVIFNHHCPLARADHEHFRRCAARQPTHTRRCPRTLRGTPRHVRNTRSSVKQRLQLDISSVKSRLQPCAHQVRCAPLRTAARARAQALPAAE